ncbi:MAG: LysR family transcriptional regulator, partial [Oscillospiraceae bacterium]|nr:LysR family transcriptional regulator [Oscillospiraceae bacterium]
TEALESGSLFKLKLKMPVPERSISACWLVNIELSFAAKKFIELVKVR